MPNKIIYKEETITIDEHGIVWYAGRPFRSVEAAKSIIDLFK